MPELMELRTQLDYLLEKKIVRPFTSPYAAPILFTPKKDGGLRMCTDYRALNITINSRYPIPRADDLIDQLRGARIFSKIDLRGGYHQILVAEADIPRTAFRTRYGSYEYRVMPFGLTNAPSTFQLTMNEVFRSLLDKCVIVYLNDIMVYSISREYNLTDLEAVFTLCNQDQLITKGSKCEFLKEELEFLGHVISIEGLKIDPKKNDNIRNWEPPTNVKELQSFMGFVNYVRRFIPKMVESTAPLTDYLQKGDILGTAGASQNGAVLVVVDRLTKMAHFAPCQTTITAEQTAKLFISTVVRLHGISTAIVSDHDPQFTSNFWTKMWEQYRTRLHLSMTYHPKIDGQTGRTNQTMEQLIRTTCTNPTQWEDSLPLIEFAYNNVPSSTIAQSPFYLNYGLNPTTPTTRLVESLAPRSQQFRLS
ncbi:hypothetical protein CLOP_g2654 [Closterium sp. NIES-67]|nr:hypothetical protein CLOP_g2654 [Closterium sp. NIES-67]